MVLFSNSPRQPRRKLPKRKRKRRGDESEGNVVTEDDESIWETAEVRPLISFKSKELGEDYWMDEEALKKEQERRKQKRPTPQPGQVPDEKLWDEILSPYKQNCTFFFLVSWLRYGFLCNILSSNQYSFSRDWSDLNNSRHFGHDRHQIP